MAVETSVGGTMSGSPTIWRIPLGMTSAYVVRGPVPILVDAGMTGQEAVLRFRLRRVGVELTDLALVIVTHAHSDHAGCLAWIKASTDAAIACSRPTMDLLGTGKSARMVPRTLVSRLITPLLARVAKYPAVQADVPVDEPMTLAPYGVDGTLLPTPGHTRGCLSVLVGDDAIVGDLVSGTVASPRRAAMPRLLEDREAWAASVQAVLAHGVKRMHVAHGGPFNAEDVARLL